MYYTTAALAVLALSAVFAAVVAAALIGYSHSFSGKLPPQLSPLVYAGYGGEVGGKPAIIIYNPSHRPAVVDVLWVKPLLWGRVNVSDNCSGYMVVGGTVLPVEVSRGVQVPGRSAVLLVCPAAIGAEEAVVTVYRGGSTRVRLGWS